MIESIEINNFRCFKKLSVRNCAPINVIVGDNGAGKTALLEAVFLALCTNPQHGVFLRQWRGDNPQFSGAPDAVVEALYAEFFYRLDFSQVPEVRLRGSGPEVRSLRIMRGRGDVRILSGAESMEEKEISNCIRVDRRQETEASSWRKGRIERHRVRKHRRSVADLLFLCCSSTYERS